MNKVLLVGRLTKDPDLRRPGEAGVETTFTIATNEFRAGDGERTEYHSIVAKGRLGEICAQFLSKGQLVDLVGRLRTRQNDHDDGRRTWKTEVEIESLEMLSGRAKHEYASESELAEQEGS